MCIEKKKQGKMKGTKTLNPHAQAARKFIDDCKKDEGFGFNRESAAQRRLTRLLNKTYREGFRACHVTRTIPTRDNS